MTKRKAIEAATELRSLRGMNIASVAERAYDEGRITGLREAAQMLPLAGAILWDEGIVIRERANALAKKARAK